MPDLASAANPALDYRGQDMTHHVPNLVIRDPDSHGRNQARDQNPVPGPDQNPVPGPDPDPESVSVSALALELALGLEAERGQELELEPDLGLEPDLEPELVLAPALALEQAPARESVLSWVRNPAPFPHPATELFSFLAKGQDLA